MTTNDSSKMQQLVPLLNELQRVAEKQGVPFLASVFDDGGQRAVYSAFHLPARCAGTAYQGMPVQDMADVRGQEHVRRVLEVAAAGGHHLLLIGPKGAGKGFLASSLPSILPWQIEGPATTAAYCPFRTPQPGVGSAAFIGGGRPVRPGEVTLAHGGVLFLENLPAFPERILAALRQVVETRAVSISGARGTTVFPAAFQLVGSMTLCACGYYSDCVRECTCSALDIAAYQRRVAPMVRDCFEMGVEVPRVDYDQLVRQRPGEDSARVRARVQAARARQETRFAGMEAACNARIPAEAVERLCELDAAARRLFTTAVQQLHLSATEAHRMLRVARTIADLGDNATIAANHLAEAIQYKPREPGL